MTLPSIYLALRTTQSLREIKLKHYRHFAPFAILTILTKKLTFPFELFATVWLKVTMTCFIPGYL